VKYNGYPAAALALVVEKGKKSEYFGYRYAGN